MAQLSRTNDYDVCVTTYEMIKSDGMKNKLQSIKFRSVVLDEGHRVKNDQSDISKSCKLLKSRFKVILTGTPVQNNLGEMYSLLNFLMPQIFNCKDVFENCFSLLANNIQIDRNILNNAHYMLRPFVLRRLKIEVEISLPSKLETMIKCPLSEMQSFWIKRLLLKNGDLMQRLNHDLTHKDMKG
jgi:SWI/SNF-related matrix-associated actin-dependent regulator of chromatin subfamily A member 5